MTAYTADDFKYARFATHPDGRIAARTGSDRFPDRPWRECNGFIDDQGMVAEGWVPVQEARPLTIDEVPDALVVAMLEALGCRQDGKRVSQHPALLVGRIRKGLAAALAIDTTRPEGAEDLETVIGCNAGKWTNGAEDVRELADLLASRGVRVGGEERS